MKIGSYEIFSIETSEFRLDGGAMYGIIPKTLWEKSSPADELNRIHLITRSLLLVSDNRKILIDTGNGTKWEEKYKRIYQIDTSSIILKNLLINMDMNQMISQMLFALIYILITLEETQNLKRVK